MGCSDSKPAKPAPVQGSRTPRPKQQPAPKAAAPASPAPPEKPAGGAEGGGKDEKPSAASDNGDDTLSLMVSPQASPPNRSSADSEPPAQTLPALPREPEPPAPAANGTGEVRDEDLSMRSLPPLPPPPGGGGGRVSESIASSLDNSTKFNGTAKSGRGGGTRPPALLAGQGSGRGGWGRSGRRASRSNDLALASMLNNSPRLKKKFSGFDAREVQSANASVETFSTSLNRSRVAARRASGATGATDDIDIVMPEMPAMPEMPDEMPPDIIQIEAIQVEESEGTLVPRDVGFRRNRERDTRYANCGALLAPELLPEEVEQLQLIGQAWNTATTLIRQGKIAESCSKWKRVHERLDVALQGGFNPLLEKALLFAACNWCAAMHDLGDCEGAERELRKFVRNLPEEEDPICGIIVHYNLALVLKDSPAGLKDEIEAHFRQATELLAQRVGLNEVMTLTALSELSLAVFEQARLIESYLLAKRALQGAVEVFGEGHEEVQLLDLRLQEVFEVEQWYVDGDTTVQEEILIEKLPEQGLGCVWDGSLLCSVTPELCSPTLAKMVGRELQTVNGVRVQSEDHLRRLITGASLLVLWFEEAPAEPEPGQEKDQSCEDMRSLLLQQLPSLGKIPQTTSHYHVRRRDDSISTNRSG